MSTETLLRRATYGVTHEVLEDAHRLGAHGWLRQQLNPASIDDAEMDKLLKRWPSLTWSPVQVRERIKMYAWDVMFDLVDAHIARAIWSKRQLLEIMVDFWSNHLNVTCPDGDVWDNRAYHDATVIRPHALGSFSDMLCALGKSPAMLIYLGNYESDAAHPNENWGRELLELHTIGLDYTQADVDNSARILTGLTVNSDTGMYEYNPILHATGHVKVLGFSDANHSRNGEELAMRYLRYLAHHPKTATHICSKLVTRFVCDDPPKELVSRLAETYRKHGTQIAPVLEELFNSKDFRESGDAKLKTPYEDFIATLRQLRVGPPKSGTEGVRDLQWVSGQVGQPPLAWPMPNGYADVGLAWASTAATLGKWNCHMNLAGGWWPQDLTYPKIEDFLPKHLPHKYAGLFDELASELQLRPLNDKQREALATFVGKKVHDHVESTDEAVTWQLPYVIALLLNTPQQALR